MRIPSILYIPLSLSFVPPSLCIASLLRPPLSTYVLFFVSLSLLQAFYCGVACQTLAWTVGNHRKLCKKWASESGASEGGASESGGASKSETEVASEQKTSSEA